MLLWYWSVREEPWACSFLPRVSAALHNPFRWPSLSDFVAIGIDRTYIDFENASVILILSNKQIQCRIYTLLSSTSVTIWHSMPNSAESVPASKTRIVSSKYCVLVVYIRELKCYKLTISISTEVRICMREICSLRSLSLIEFLHDAWRKDTMSSVLLDSPWSLYPIVGDATSHLDMFSLVMCFLVYLSDYRCLYLIRWFPSCQHWGMFRRCRARSLLRLFY